MNGHIFLARYHGRCAVCDEVIHPLDKIVYVDDEVAHADCDEHATPERLVTVCQTCHLTKPCDCEDTR